MPSQVDILASLVQVVSVNNRVISDFSDVGALPFFPITLYVLFCILILKIVSREQRDNKDDGE